MTRIFAYMEEKGLDGILLTSPPNVAWISGFTGTSSQILLTPKRSYFITDFRYDEQAKQEVAEVFKVMKSAPQERLGSIEQLLDKHDVKTLGIEAEHVTLEMMHRYQQTWFVRYEKVDGFFKSLRAVKTPEEIKAMEEGAALTQGAFEHLLGVIRPGVRETEILAELVYYFNQRGAVPSFPPIIAGGPNSALPHATVSDRPLEAGDFLTMDFGCKFHGMCTDFTRTIALGGVEPKLEMIYNTVRCAQEAALLAVRAGVAASEVDEAARSIIREAGYGEYFEHSTGHGVGAVIHEAPTLSVTSKDILEPGMVVTIEPGVYLPKKAGVRVEDMVVVTEEGAKNFYTATKELIIL